MAATTVADVFSKAQVSFGAHKKAAALLHRLRIASPDSFDDEFFACVACVLEVYKREPAAERIVEFVVEFATQSSEDEAFDEAFMQSLCMRLLRLAHAKDKAVRFRVAQLVCRMLNSMAEDAEVSDDLFEAVEEAMLSRCRDKVPLVRAWALRALFRLQNPLDPSDAFTVELLRLMATDGSKEVRMAAISTVAPSKHSIKAILARTRDVSEEVRLHALGVLAGKVEMRWLSISQRASLLQTGLQDRQPKVRESCAQLLVGSWLRKLDNQPLQLLKALDVATYPEAADLALEALLADKGAAPLVAAAAEGWGALGPEAALCLRARLRQLAAAADEAGLEAARPELGVFCERLQAAVEATQTRGPAAGAGAAKGGAGSGSSGAEEYTLAQLLCAAEHLDMADEHGRAQLEGLLGALLKELATSAELLPQLMRGLEAACGGEAERYQRLVLELIAEVEDPLEAGELGEASGADPAEAAAQLQREEETMLADNKAFELRAELAAAVAEEDFDRAAALKQEVSALQQRLEALREATAAMTPEHERLRRSMRCLQLAELLLQAPSLRLREHELAHLLERLVPALQSHHAELRALAMRCVSLYAHSAHAAALRFWPLLLKALRHDVQLVQLAALRAVVDLLHLHGPAALLPTAPPAAAPPAAAPAAPQESAHAAEAARLLLPLLEQPPGALRSAAAVGVAKLLHAGRVVSSHLLSRLLLLYFEPVEMESPEPEAQAEQAVLKQRLAVYFAAAGRPVAAALLPAVRAALAAAPGSANAGVEVEDMMKFVLALTREEAPAEGGRVTMHEELALALCCEVSLGADDKEGRLLPKALPHLHLHAGGARLPQLAALAERAAASLTDKAALRHVQKLQERLALLATAQPQEGEEPPSVEDILAAHSTVRDADVDSASGRARERQRGEEEAEDSAQRVLTPSKGKAKPRRRLAKSKATPTRFASMDDIENEATAA